MSQRSTVHINHEAPFSEQIDSITRFLNDRARRQTYLPLLTLLSMGGFGLGLFLGYFTWLTVDFHEWGHQLAAFMLFTPSIRSARDAVTVLGAAGWWIRGSGTNVELLISLFIALFTALRFPRLVPVGAFWIGAAAAAPLFFVHSIDAANLGPAGANAWLVILIIETALGVMAWMKGLRMSTGRRRVVPITNLRRSGEV